MDHCYKHDPIAIINFVLTLMIAFLLIKAFYQGNLKPKLRARFTVIAIATELNIGLAVSQIRAPWLVLIAGRPP